MLTTALLFAALQAAPPQPATRTRPVPDSSRIHVTQCFATDCIVWMSPVAEHVDVVRAALRKAPDTRPTAIVLRADTAWVELRDANAQLRTKQRVERHKGEWVAVDTITVMPYSHRQSARPPFDSSIVAALARQLSPKPDSARIWHLFFVHRDTADVMVMTGRVGQNHRYVRRDGRWTLVGPARIGPGR